MRGAGTWDLKVKRLQQMGCSLWGDSKDGAPTAARSAALGKEEKELSENGAPTVAETALVQSGHM